MAPRPIFWGGRSFLAGVRDARDRSASPLSHDSNIYLMRLENRLSVLGDRLAVRDKARWMRLPGVLRLWRKGAYGEFSGAKSAVRDLLFRCFRKTWTDQSPRYGSQKTG